MVLLACCLPALALGQQRSPFFATVVGPDGEAIAGAEVTCVFTPNLFADGEVDIVSAVSDDRGRARCNLVVGRSYQVWAVGPGDSNGSRLVSESVPLAAAGRVMELSAFERIAERRVTMHGAQPWRDVGGLGLRWYPDATQDLHVDLPWPLGDTLTLPPSPWSIGSLGIHDAAGAEMVTVRIDPGSIAADFAPPMEVRAIVVNDRREPMGDVLIERCTGMTMTWGLFANMQPVERYAIVGRTAADGIANLHLPTPSGPGGWVLQAGRGDTSWCHQAVMGPGSVRFSVHLVEPIPLQVKGIDGQINVTATGGFSVARGKWTYLWARRLRVESDTRGGWLIHRPGESFIPRVAVADKVPGALVWDWGAEQNPSVIDAGKLNEVNVQVVDAAGGPVAAALGVMHGAGSVPLRWQSLLATDVAGRAKLWLPEVAQFVYVTTGSEHAFQMVEGTGSRDLQLRLSTLPSMRVHVTDGGKPVSAARAEVVSIEAVGSGMPKSVAMFLSFNYAKLTHSDKEGWLEVRSFFVPGMRQTLKVVRGDLESEPFPFEVDGKVEVGLAPRAAEEEGAQAGRPLRGRGR